MATPTDKPIFVRVSADERAWFEAAARVEGYRSFSEWVRQTLRAKALELVGAMP